MKSREAEGPGYSLATVHKSPVTFSIGTSRPSGVIVLPYSCQSLPNLTSIQTSLKPALFTTMISLEYETATRVLDSWDAARRATSDEELGRLIVDR